MTHTLHLIPLKTPHIPDREPGQDGRRAGSSCRPASSGATSAVAEVVIGSIEVLIAPTSVEKQFGLFDFPAFLRFLHRHKTDIDEEEGRRRGRFPLRQP